MNRKIVLLHQALHGYDGGHRLISSSLQEKLNQRDAKTLLTLSDLAGPFGQLDEDGYLSGYPLIESGLYAIARTWPATEMSRPGCVWTHTLLIEFADLAALEDLQAFRPLFRRPHPGCALNYCASTIAFESGEPKHRLAVELSPSSRVWTRRLLRGLYETPTQPLVLPAPYSSDAELIVLEVLAQQWPRLRRAFRFCTYTEEGRADDSQAFDLQVLPSPGKHGRQHAEEAQATYLESAGAPWLDVALTDIERPNQTGLRTFLKKVAGDVPGGRERFVPLCRIFHSLNSTSPDTFAPSAVEILSNELSSVPARAVRTEVASAAARRLESLDDVGLDFIARNLDSVDLGVLESKASAIGRRLWHRRPQEFAALTASDSPTSQKVVSRTFAAMPPEELIEGLRDVDSIAPAVVGRRPDILSLKEYWQLSSRIDSAGLHGLRELSGDKTGAVRAMMRSRRTDLAADAVDAVGPRSVWDALATTLDEEEEGPRRFYEWISAAAQEVDPLAHLLVVGAFKRKTSLVAICRAIHPDTVPNEQGDDPWLVAERSSSGALQDSDLAFLKAYFLARALGNRSRNAAGLAASSFDTIYSYAAMDRMPSDAWSLLNERLPTSMFWFGWDHCKRLRAGVASLFVERQLDPFAFGTVTGDDKLFSELVDEASWMVHGRDYLRQARGTLQSSPDESLHWRADAIRKAIKDK